MLWHYAKGRPKEMVVVDITATTMTATIDPETIESMTTQELEAARI